jgi:hypothetical protein
MKVNVSVSKNHVTEVIRNYEEINTNRQKR